MSTARRYDLRPEFGNAGFTLLEIIAVLVIMSILAVVAVPKYFDLQNQARQKAMDSAMAEAIGRVNNYFAQQLLSGQLPENITYDTTTVGGTPDATTNTNMGDFNLEVVQSGTGAGSTITLTVTPVAAALTDTQPAVRTIPRPGLPEPATTPAPTPVSP